ncbi:uncharacterized protein LOC109600672 isoform X2 [Aethina tumida]|uniref:uncharacterized protein LOC109600672 isoform X2 n=1 Tax=Aethina tumida TaxID=116153 RepID=UPI0021480A48|nr:uncharacterized protein LOC109600672 isoform X2 [Aethina tumida]
MTNGGRQGQAPMAAFMTRKKKYKFQVEVCLEELLEVPLITAVLFAKLRLVDGGNFQDNSSREEVRDHKVKWDAKFTFPCKMMANASTGVMERCVLRISIRKETGRSFTKLGFVDLNLAEYAGAGVTHRKALLEGYDARRRQDNSMLQFSITMNMLQGDILFKVPSPSLKHKQIIAEDTTADNRNEEFTSGSLAGSIASGSSGFGSLPKKRPQLLTSELVIGQTLTENNVPVTVATDYLEINPQQAPEHDEPTAEPGHSRNSSNTSQLSKASGYSSIHSHSRQSSSGDSGHIREPQHRSLRINNNKNQLKFPRTNTYPKHLKIPNTISQDEVFFTPQIVTEEYFSPIQNGFLPDLNSSNYSTPVGLNHQISNISTSSNEQYATPECSFTTKSDLFSQNFVELQKSSSTSVVVERNSDYSNTVDLTLRKSDSTVSQPSKQRPKEQMNDVLRSKSEFEIPRVHEQNNLEKSSSTSRFFKSDSLFSFLTPRPKRKGMNDGHSTPNNPQNAIPFKVPSSPIPKHQLNGATSISSLRSGLGDGNQLGVQSVPRNPSSSSLVISETGSLDRVKTSYDRRKKTQASEDAVSGRVETTRVNPGDLIEELLKNTNLEPTEDSAETSGLQLFIAKDGTAALGNHEVKSQMSTGVQVFKQVVMDDR